LRLKFVAIGMILIFVGLLFVSVSQTSVTTPKDNVERIAYGDANSTKINATLNAGDEFSMSYSGGSPLSSPEEIDVNITDPRNESRIVPYTTAHSEGSADRGIVANYSGLYKMELLGVFIDYTKPPIILTVMKIQRWKETTYPNSDMLPVGISIIVVGTGLFIWGATSSKGRRVRGKVKR